MVVVDLKLSMFVKAIMTTAEVSPFWNEDFQLCWTAARDLGSEAGPLLSKPKFMICGLETKGIISPLVSKSGKDLGEPVEEVGRRLAAMAMPPEGAQVEIRGVGLQIRIEVREKCVRESPAEQADHLTLFVEQRTAERGTIVYA